MKRNLTNYLIAVIFTGALINPLATSAVLFLTKENEDSEYEFCKKVMPIWREQVTLLLTRMKSDAKLADHIQEYRDEFNALNKKYDIDNHIGLVRFNQNVYEPDLWTCKEILEILDSLWTKDAMALWEEMRADKQLKDHLAQYKTKFEQLIKKHNVTKDSLSFHARSAYMDVENLMNR